MSEFSKTVQLSVSGASARIVPDGFSDAGYVLEIGGAEQSHVDLNDPSYIFYEYLRRIGNVIDTLAPAGDKITAAHLGAGAFTLVRYIQATRPGSAQVAVDIERELPSLVMEYLPLPAGTHCRVVIDDARAATADLPQQVGAEKIDAIILDIFSGWSAPEHLAEQSYYRELKDILAPGGALIVNVGDDAGLSFFTAQAQSLLDVYEHVWCLAPTNMMSGHHAGNLVLVATNRALTDELRARLLGAGPHPAAVLDTHEVQDLLEDLRS